MITHSQACAKSVTVNVNGVARSTRPLMIDGKLRGQLILTMVNVDGEELTVSIYANFKQTATGQPGVLSAVSVTARTEADSMFAFIDVYNVAHDRRPVYAELNATEVMLAASAHQLLAVVTGL